MLIVKKFGGTSVADKERIFNVARRCIKDYQAGHDVVVVLSAMGKQTDVLIDMAKDINPKPPKRAMDMLLTTGEQTSVALMEMAMAALNVPAVSLNAFQVAMHTTSAYSNARLKRIDTERIRHEIDQRRIVIVTGFQGINKYDDYTTLGRGGWDGVCKAYPAASEYERGTDQWGSGISAYLLFGNAGVVPLQFRQCRIQCGREYEETSAVSYDRRHTQCDPESVFCDCFKDRCPGCGSGICDLTVCVCISDRKGSVPQS